MKYLQLKEIITVGIIRKRPRAFAYLSELASSALLTEISAGLLNEKIVFCFGIATPVESETDSIIDITNTNIMTDKR